MECNIFARLETHFTIGFSQKTRLERIATAVIMLLYIFKQSQKSIISIYNEFSKFLKITWISSASQPAIRHNCARCRALKITQNNRLLRWIYETVVLKTIFLLCHGDSFVLPYITSFPINWNA